MPLKPTSILTLVFVSATIVSSAPVTVRDDDPLVSDPLVPPESCQRLVEEVIDKWGKELELAFVHQSVFIDAEPSTSLFPLRNEDACSVSRLRAHLLNGVSSGTARQHESEFDLSSVTDRHQVIRLILHEIGHGSGLGRGGSLLPREAEPARFGRFVLAETGPVDLDQALFGIFDQSVIPAGVGKRFNSMGAEEKYQSVIVDRDIIGRTPRSIWLNGSDVMASGAAFSSMGDNGLWGGMEPMLQYKRQQNDGFARELSMLSRFFHD